jgi:hypothetical protein
MPLKAGKQSGSFLKKRTKKLLLPVGCVSGVATARRKQKFFGYFFSKKVTALLSLLWRLTAVLWIRFTKVI